MAYNGKGKGTIYFDKQRKNYRVYAPVIMIDGRKVRKNLGSYKSEEDAKRVLANHTLLPISNKFGDIVDLWYNERIKSEVKENSIISITFGFNAIKKLFSGILTTDIKNIHNKDINTIFQNSCYSYASLSKILTYLKDIFDFALSNNFIDRHYISSRFIKLPRLPKKTKNLCSTYSLEDINKVYDTISGDASGKEDKLTNYMKVFIILAYTGLRKSELFDSDTHINLIDNTITVKSAKTKNSIRVIPIHWKIQKFFQEDVIATVNYKSLNYHFELINKQFKIPNYNIHSLRKFFITQLISQNANLPLVAKLVGHSTKSVTIDIYTKPNIEELRKVVNLLE